MPKTRKLTATHEGATFTRRTHRTYSHVIVGKPGHDRAIKQARALAAQNTCKANFDFYVQESGPNARYADMRTDAELAFYKEIVALGHEAWTAQVLAKHLARVEARRAAGEFDTFAVFSWAGRADLAAKQVSKARDAGMLEVAAVAVQS